RTGDRYVRRHGRRLLDPEAGWAGDDRQLGETTEDEPVAVAPVEVLETDRRTELREAVQQRTEGQLSFHARQRGAEAEVDTVAEGEVTDVRPVDVERLGLRVPLLVPVGRRQRDDHLGPGRDRRAAQLHLLDRVAERRVRNGRVVTQQLLHGAGDPARVGSQARQLVRVP